MSSPPGWPTSYTACSARCGYHNLPEQVTQGTLVKFVVVLKNTGQAASRGGDIEPTRIYADGPEAYSALKDTLVDIRIPSDGKWHAFWHVYTVGPGHTVVGCRAYLMVDGLIGRAERDVRLSE